MKNLRHAFFIASALLIFSNLSAQRNRVEDTDTENFFRGGLKAGFNINKVPGKSLKTGFNFNFQVGGFLQFNFSRRFGLQPEANFVQSSSEYSSSVSDIFNDLFRDGTQKNTKLDYLEIPILVNMNIGESRHVKLQAGPSYSFLLKKTAANVKADTVSYLNKHGEFGLIGGVWIQLPFINIGARYKLGLSKVNNVTNTQQWRNSAIEAAIGFTL